MQGGKDPGSQRQHSFDVCQHGCGAAAQRNAQKHLAAAELAGAT